MILQEQLTAWMNISLAYDNASRGKRGHAPAAEFEMARAKSWLIPQGEPNTKQPRGLDIKSRCGANFFHIMNLFFRDGGNQSA